MDRRVRRLLLPLLLALLPGIALAGVGGLRICLSAAIGLGDCCEPSADGPDCCSDMPAPSELPGPAPGDDCAWCCVEFDPSAPIVDESGRGPLQPLLAEWGSTPRPEFRRGPTLAHVAGVHAARPPPEGRFNQPLRI